MVERRFSQKYLKGYLKENLSMGGGPAWAEIQTSELEGTSAKHDFTMLPFLYIVSNTHFPSYSGFSPFARNAPFPPPPPSSKNRGIQFRHPFVPLQDTSSCRKPKECGQRRSRGWDPNHQQDNKIANIFLLLPVDYCNGGKFPCGWVSLFVKNVKKLWKNVDNLDVRVASIPSENISSIWVEIASNHCGVFLFIFLK